MLWPDGIYLIHVMEKNVIIQIRYLMSEFETTFLDTFKVFLLQLKLAYEALN